MKEQAISSVEAYGKAVENAAYDKVLNILHSKYNQLDNVISSNEAWNIYAMSTGNGFRRLQEKRCSLRMKIYAICDIMSEVSELRYGKY